MGEEESEGAGFAVYCGHVVPMWKAETLPPFPQKKDS